MKEKEAATTIFFQMALKSCGITLDTKTADMVLLIAKAIIEKGDQFSLKDAAQIMVEVKDRNL